MESLDVILAGHPVLLTKFGEAIYLDHDYLAVTPHMSISITDGTDYASAVLTAEEVALLSHYLITWLEERGNVSNG